MTTHNLSLTYAPKIEAVKSGECRQTIRAMNPEHPKYPGDNLRFHTWAGKPYHSKWDWRSPLWKLVDVLRIAYDPFKYGWSWAELKEVHGFECGKHNASGIYLHRATEGMTIPEMVELAHLDWIPGDVSFTQVFLSMHPEMRYSYVPFEVLRW